MPLLASPAKRRVIDDTDDEELELYQSIHSVREAASNAASQLESFLHLNDGSVSNRLDDDDDCSIDGELLRLEHLEEDIRRELDGIRLDTNDYNTYKMACTMDENDASNEYDYTSPLKPALSKDDDHEGELPALMLSPLSSTSAGHSVSTPTRCMLNSPDHADNLEPPGENASSDDTGMMCNFRRQACNEQGFRMFQHEVDDLLLSVRGESLVATCSGAFGSGACGTIHERDTVIAQSLISTLASGLYGKWEYSVAMPWLLSNHRCSLSPRTVQGTVGVLLASVLVVMCLCKDSPYLSLMLGAAPLMVTWLSASFSFSFLDETVISYCCWIAVSFRLLLN